MMTLTFDGAIGDRHPAERPRSYLEGRGGVDELVICELCAAAVPITATARHDEWHTVIGAAVYGLGQR